MPPLLPAMLDVFVAEVIPLLQRRGLFRTAYTGATLRDHYGLARPESAFAERANSASGRSQPQIEFADQLVVVERVGDSPSKAILPWTMT